jgi:N-terminal domain of toast_rack, DUF2154
MKRGLVTIACLSLLALPALACTITLPAVKTQVGELHRESVNVPLDDAKAADVKIVFGMGELRLRPGEGEDLLKADFIYNVDELKPVLEHNRRSDRLTVNLRPGTKGVSLNLGDGMRNEWDVRLSDQVPTYLNLDLGAAKGQMDLGGLRLTDARIKVGAAEADVEWSKPNSERLDLLDVDAGASSLEMHQLGNAHFHQMNFIGGAGNFNLDFTGDWQESGRVNINAGLGNLILVLPHDVGVRVDTGDKALVNVSAEGFRRQGTALVNDAYGESRLELAFTINMGLGNLTLIEK